MLTQRISAEGLTTFIFCLILTLFWIPNANALFYARFFLIAVYLLAFFWNQAEIKISSSYPWLLGLVLAALLHPSSWKALAFWQLALAMSVALFLPVLPDKLTIKRIYQWGFFPLVLLGLYQRLVLHERAFATLLQPNVMGLYATILLYWAQEEKSKWRWIFSISALTGVLLSGSRAALLAILIGLIVWGLQQKPKRILFWAIPLLLGGLLTIFLIGRSESVWARWKMWQFLWHWKAVLWGTGFDRFFCWSSLHRWPFYSYVFSEELILHAHNEFLQWIIEAGFLGVLALIFWLKKWWQCRFQLTLFFLMTALMTAALVTSAFRSAVLIFFFWAPVLANSRKISLHPRFRIVISGFLVMAMGVFAQQVWFEHTHQLFLPTMSDALTYCRYQYYQGAEAMQQQEWQAAETAYQRILNQCVGFPQVNRHMGTVLLKQQKAESADFFFQRENRYHWHPDLCFLQIHAAEQRQDENLLREKFQDYFQAIDIFIDALSPSMKAKFVQREKQHLLQVARRWYQLFPDDKKQIDHWMERYRPLLKNEKRVE